MDSKMSSQLNIVLYEPEIPPNTGNIIRLAANIGAKLHLIHPLGFELTEKTVRRAGLDYHQLTYVHEYENYDDFIQKAQPERIFALSTHGKKNYTDSQFQANDYLMFGPETRGIPADLRESLDSQNVLRLPMMEGNRSINLSNTVAIVAYEAWRQMGFCGGS